MSVLILAGENSGDQHAAKVAKLLARNHILWGTGGSMMNSAGVELIASTEQMACIGILEPITKIKFFFRLQQQIINQIRTRKTELAILVDFGGFNLKIARKLHEEGIPILYFITPKFWAWGEKRLEKIKKYIEHAAVILPFEAEILIRNGVKATYVGNPLTTKVPRRKRANNSVPVIGLMPGSRINEIKNHLSLFIESAKKLQESTPCKIVISKSPNLPSELFAKLPEEIEVFHNHYDLIEISDVVLVASGTASLEVALMERPMIIVYRSDWLTYILFKIFAKTEFIGLPNIITNSLIAPELIQTQASKKRIVGELNNILANPKIQVKHLKTINSLLKTEFEYQEIVSGIAEEIIKKQSPDRGKSGL